MGYGNRRYDYRPPDRRRYNPAPVHRQTRRYTFHDFALPVCMLIVGIATLMFTIFAASAGLFGSRNDSSGVPGVASGAASSALRTPRVDETSAALLEKKANTLLAAMSTEQKVGQLLLLRSHDLSDGDFCHEISDTCAGGVVLFANDVKNRSGDELTAYIRLLQQSSDGGMLVCVDEEGGSVVRVSSNRRLRDSSFASPQQLYADGGMERISSDAAEKAAFLHQYGFNVNFAPVADVVTDTGAMMYRRAFGQDAAATAEYVSAVVTASEAGGVGSCVKHFPGYGNTAGDTHNGVVTLDTPLDELRANDFVPFSAGIEAGCGAVMITHTVMSAIDPDHPASMSPAVISLLRDELGFEGVTISDGMDMGAIRAFSDGRNVCVTAFLAGVDLMCTPGDGRAAHKALLDAVNDGTIPMGQLDEAVRRILGWKLSLGLYAAPAE